MQRLGRAAGRGRRLRHRHDVGDLAQQVDHLLHHADEVAGGDVLVLEDVTEVLPRREVLNGQINALRDELTRQLTADRSRSNAQASTAATSVVVVVLLVAALGIALGLVLTAIIIAHIYIGTLGMEGAFDAMGSGDVNLNWAREHHSLWAAEIENGSPDAPAAPGSPEQP